MGYFYPSHFPAMQEHADRLDTYLKRADLRTLLLIDRLEPEKKLTEEYAQVIRPFAELASIQGFFYLEYKAYALHSGRILQVGDKPLVTARFDFRSDAFYENVRSNPADETDVTPISIAAGAPSGALPALPRAL